MTKFRIPVGIPQNSEFCRKLLSITSEPRSNVLFIFIFCRQELMHLDLRCDTRICGSQAESYHNHTNGMQHVITCTSANASRPMKNTIIIAICIAQSWPIFQLNCYFGPPPWQPSISVNKGNKVPPPPTPSHEYRTEAGKGEIAWVPPFLFHKS